jgi:hypothetical protein
MYLVQWMRRYDTGDLVTASLPGTLMHDLLFVMKDSGYTVKIMSRMDPFACGEGQKTQFKITKCSRTKCGKTFKFLRSPLQITFSTGMLCWWPHNNLRTGVSIGDLDSPLGRPCFFTFLCNFGGQHFSRIPFVWDRGQNGFYTSEDCTALALINNEWRGEGKQGCICHTGLIYEQCFSHCALHTTKFFEWKMDLQHKTACATLLRGPKCKKQVQKLCTCTRTLLYVGGNHVFDGVLLYLKKVLNSILGFLVFFRFSMYEEGSEGSGQVHIRPESQTIWGPELFVYSVT